MTEEVIATLKDRLVLDVVEAASLLGIGKNQAYEAVRRGELPSLRVGRRILVPVPALLELLGINDEWDKSP